MQRIVLVVAALMICTTSTAVAQDNPKDKANAISMTIGDKAPALDIAHWVKGEIVEKFESGKIYIVEFWATWSEPCITEMPHLSDLKEKYVDYNVQFISVSNEPLAEVVSFLFEKDKADGKIQNERTRYTVTSDPDKSVMTDYLHAAGQTGLPCAFIIGKDTRIEWIGNPENMDDALEAVVKSTWDRQEFKIAFETAIEKRRKAEAERQERARAAVAQRQKFTKAMQNEDWAPAVEISWGNANALNRIAWRIADNSDVKNRDFKIALKAAKRANELTDEKSAAILDTLARVYYETGKLSEALIWQRKTAEALPEGSPMADGILEYLKKYEKEASSDA